jgi:hypothetical protein
MSAGWYPFVDTVQRGPPYILFSLVITMLSLLRLQWSFSSTEHGTRVLVDESFFLTKLFITTLSTGVQEQQLKMVEV